MTYLLRKILSTGGINAKKGENRMKIRLNPGSRKFFGKFVTVAFVLVLSVLITVSLIVSLVAFAAVKTLIVGLFVIGFQTPFALFFAFAVTAFAAWVAWFCYSLTRDVWAEFSLHRTARKASAGSP